MFGTSCQPRRSAVQVRKPDRQPALPSQALIAMRLQRLGHEQAISPAALADCLHTRGSLWVWISTAVPPCFQAGDCLELVAKAPQGAAFVLGARDGTFAFGGAHPLAWVRQIWRPSV